MGAYKTLQSPKTSNIFHFIQKYSILFLLLLWFKFLVSLDKKQLHLAGMMLMVMKYNYALELQQRYLY